MLVRIGLLLVVATSLVSYTVAQEDDPARLLVGDSIFLEFKGQPAIEFMKLLDNSSRDIILEEVGILLEAEIVKDEPDGLVAEYCVLTGRDTEKARIVTVAVSFKREEMEAPTIYNTTSMIPASAEERQRMAFAKKYDTLPKVRKDAFGGVKFGVWALESEISN